MLGIISYGIYIDLFIGAYYNYLGWVVVGRVPDPCLKGDIFLDSADGLVSTHTV